ncbi:MAG: penicillin-insensitive murein endopeptidase [Myxococcales bacterium]|nr:penicillin-insensitive murein endopeptidase [Myxococcales bacterium]
MSWGPATAGRRPRAVRAWVSRLAFGVARSALALPLLPPDASAAPRARLGLEVSLKPPPGMRSRSLQHPWEGRLARGMLVKESEYIRYVDEYRRKGHFYGTWELVQLLERAARRVAFRLPGSKLSIGELSRREGGPIGGHRSHESGRDVDIGFYMTLPDGRPYYTYSFADFDHRGRGLRPNGYLRFDDARNWELVAKLVADGDARVQYIFVGSDLKARLLREGARRGAPRAVLERAKAVLMQPAHGHPHRNHFHVRIYCAPADQGQCRDRAPFWPWYPGTPPGGQYSRITSPFAGLADP